MKKFLFLMLSVNYFIFSSYGQGDGFLIKNGKLIFPIGWYVLPEKDSELAELADAGINLINCNSKEGLDRVQAAGIQAWVPLRMQDGPTEEFKKTVQNFANHPALAIWEGPDEIVWNFTGWSGLYKNKIHSIPGGWQAQTPEAVKFANEQARKIIPNIHQSISFIRSIDSVKRQVWINEASSSDASYIYQYIDAIDITGCDYYPITVHPSTGPAKIRKNVEEIAFYTERYNEIGKGKPVWMILQAFSWHELGGQYEKLGLAYPSFEESRYMAYDAIAHGSEGIIYYGAEYCKSKDFLQSLFALTSELDALQDFLVTPQLDHVSAYAVKERGLMNPKVQCITRLYSRDWLIVLVNETDELLTGVSVKGLKNLNGLKFYELYSSNEFEILNEEFVTRMKPRDVKVFSTSKKYETDRLTGRKYNGM